jgi:hypothetical protein
MRTITAAAALGGALLGAAPALAQDEWAAQVERIMEAATRSMAEEGYQYGGYSHAGSLNEGAVDTLSLRLGGGMTTQLVGVCDTDCSDLDMRLNDANGNTIDVDVLDDDAPIVSVTPGNNGAYTLEVQMVACSEEPCRYAVQQYVK